MPDQNILPYPSGERTPENCGIVIFGASGDLTQRKLMPAIYNLFLDGLLPEKFAIIGFARSELTRDQFADASKEAINRFSRQGPAEDQSWARFQDRLFYQQGDYADPESFARLEQFQRTIDSDSEMPGNWLYYLSTPPAVYADIGRSLRERGLSCGFSDDSPWARLVVEKPIGSDLNSARQLNDALSGVCDESHIFRIDHYLGKETVQNIMVLRFANGIFEPLWNHGHIDHVQITVAESVGVGIRGRYYDHSGALRDMMQNHLLQLLCLTAMEPPHNLGADAIRDEKLAVLESIRPFSPPDVHEFAVRGQYGPGLVEDEPARGYRQEDRVAENSSTESYAAVKILLDNWRWSGVPFYLRTGKRLAKTTAEISIQFKNVPPILFNQSPAHPLQPNVLSIRIQPDEGVSLRIGAKVPGPRPEVKPVKLDFGYKTVFHAGTPEAYERLLLDVMLGDTTLFMRRDEVETAWAFITPILEAWAETPLEDFPNYMAGSWGPVQADELLSRDGRRWMRL